MTTLPVVRSSAGSNTSNMRSSCTCVRKTATYERESGPQPHPILLGFLVELPSVTATGRWRERGGLASKPSVRAVRPNLPAPGTTGSLPLPVEARGRWREGGRWDADANLTSAVDAAASVSVRLLRYNPGTRSNEPRPWDPIRRLRDRFADWRGRDGCGLPRPRHETES